MRNGRFLGGLTAVVVALSLLVSACGTSHPAAPSGLDPAKLAPAGSLIYVSLDVRPQGAQAAQTRATLHKLFGSSVDASIRQTVNKLLSKVGGSYSSNVKPWLGQRIGLVVTQLVPGATGASTRSGVAVIAPTQNPSAARSFIARLVRRTPGTAGKVTGGYAVFGGTVAYQQILATNASNSLASTPSYQSTAAQLGPAPAAMVWINLHRFIGLFAAQMSHAGAYGSLLKRTVARFGPSAAAAAGLTLTPSAIKLDVVDAGVKSGAAQRSPANVGSLPSGSWLALATGSLGAGFQKGFQTGFQASLMNAFSQSGGAANPLAGAMIRRLSLVEREILPALGPMSVAVGGSSVLSLTAGLKLTPSSAAAGARLLGLIRGLITRSPALNVTGKPTNFSVQLPTGSRLKVAETHRTVVATYGFQSQSAFLSPASKLAQDPAYRQAVAQLPSSHNVPLYISFPPIASIVQLLDHQPSAAKTVRTLDRLNYLIIGGSQGHIRLVLGLR